MDSTIAIRNLTMMTPPNINPIFTVAFQYGGLGNMTFKDINLTQYYNSILLGTTTFAILERSECIRNDDVTQAIDVQNMNISLPDNPYGLKKIFVVFDFSLASTRKHILTIDNVYIHDFKNSFYPPLVLQGDYNDDLYLSNVLMKNYLTFLAFTFWSKAQTIKNFYSNNFIKVL